MTHANDCAVRVDRECGLCSCGADEIPAMRDERVATALEERDADGRTAAVAASKQRADRALAALTVVEAAFAAAWPVVLNGLDTVPADKDSDHAAVRMFDLERGIKEICAALRRKI